MNHDYKHFLFAVSNGTRLEIVFLLRKNALNVTQITKRLGYDQSTVSNSLKMLKDCGLVSVKSHGKERIYSLNKSTVEPLLRLIDKHIDKYCR